MNGKDFWGGMVRTYFILVTLITITLYVMGMLFDPNRQLGYEAFAAPLIYAGCTVVVNVVMYSKKELTIKAFLFRKVIQFFLLEGIILFVIYGSVDVLIENRSSAMSIMISVFVIFVLSHAVLGLENYLSAKKMTEELIEFQKNAR